MPRLQSKAEKMKEREFLLELKALIQEAIKENKGESEEEWKIHRDVLVAKIREKEVELEKKVKQLQSQKGQAVWDFGNERLLEVFAEDDTIYLRHMRESEKDHYMQVKWENSELPDLYEEEDSVQRIWEDMKAEKSFCCSIIRKSDNAFIGYVSIKDTSSNLWEIAIELLKSHCHKGYGSLALKLFLPAVSQITGKTQFQALVETDNEPSQRLMERCNAGLIDIYDYTFHGDEEAAFEFEEKNMGEITDRMVCLADKLGVEPRKMLSHVLDYRFFVKEGRLVKKEEYM